MRRISVILGAVALIGSSVFAAPPTGQPGGATTAAEPGALLIPVVPHSGEAVPGAHGSLWGGIVYFHNPGPGEVAAPQSSGICGMFCLEPGTTIELSPKRIAADRGSLLPVSGIYEARLEEFSKPGQPVGVEIPVVYPSQYISDQITLVGIPRSDSVRAALRVYDPLRDARTAVRAEFLDSSGEVLATTILQPGADPVVTRSDDLAQFLPGFDAIYDVESVFPVLRTIDGEFRENRIYNIRLTTLVEGTVFWAFVSVTDIETQNVTLISP